MKLLEAVHERHVVARRASRLAAILADVLPEAGQCLDVGCGDGRIDRLIMDLRPHLRIHGVDTLVREEACLSVTQYDGTRLPYPDSSFDVVLIVDVLHHAEDPGRLLGEACRVSQDLLVIKDHLLEGWLGGPTLRIMDRVGNCRFGVRLPYHFWPRARWEQAWRELGLSVSAWVPFLGLYPWYCSWLFDRGLHFVARLEKPRNEANRFLRAPQISDG